MDTIRCFILDELKTFPSSTVDQQIMEYNAFPADVQPLLLMELMDVKVRSSDLNHVNHAVEELTLMLQTEDLPLGRRSYAMALMAVAHYRLGNLEMCSGLVAELAQIPVLASSATHSLTSYLERQLNTSRPVFVAKAVTKAVAISVGFYCVAKHGPQVASSVIKGIKSVFMKNMEVAYKDDGKFGLVFKYPGHGQIG